MAYPQVTASPLTQVDSTAQNPLGALRVEGSDEYRYLEGAASVVAGDVVTYDEAFAVTRLVTGGAAGPVGVAMAAIVATKYGWFQTEGSATGNVAANFADGGLIFSTATAGVVDDAPVSNSQVIGAVGRSAIASGQATIQLSHPWFGALHTVV